MKNISKGIALACPFYFLSICILAGQDLSDQIIWRDTKAIGLTVPKDNSDKEPDELGVFLEKKSSEVLGLWKEESDSFIFYPAIPFTIGLKYEVKIAGNVVGEFTVPYPAEQDSPSVLEIYPTSKVVPENMLKIHIRFSEPMQEGKAMQYVQLTNEHREVIPQVFLDLKPELWNADQTMLTLWLDPGRIKRDLQPNLKMGAPLVEGNSYRLVVANAWNSQHGVNLKEAYVKEFVVSKADRESPDVNQWQVTYPSTNTREAINVDFGEALDATLAESAIRIVHEGETVLGQVTLAEGENGWKFEPESLWQPGEYQLIVETRLEDLAGNNLNRPFDRDLLNVDNTNAETKQIEIPFSLKKSQDP